MTESNSLRERNKLARRDQLSVTTVLLAQERGLDNIRVDDIVERVGVSRRTFANYFSSKEDAIADRHVQRVRTAAEELVRRPADEPLWTALTEVLLAPYASQKDTTPSQEEQSGLLAVLSAPDTQSAVDRGARAANALLAAAIAERTGASANDPLPLVLAAATLAALLATLESWVASTSTEPLEPLLRRTFDRLGAGFSHLG